MRETGAILVPTRTIIEDILANLTAVPEYAATKLVAIADVHAQAVALALQRGVTIAMGTDIGLTGSDMPNSWGKNGAELPHLVARYERLGYRITRYMTHRGYDEPTWVYMEKRWV